MKLHKNMPEEGEQIVTIYISAQGKLFISPVMKVGNRDGYSLTPDEYVAGNNRHTIINLWPCEVNSGPAFAPIGMAPVTSFVNARHKDIEVASKALRESYVMQCQKVVERLTEKINEVQMCANTCAEEGKL